MSRSVTYSEPVRHNVRKSRSNDCACPDEKTLHRKTDGSLIWRKHISDKSAKWFHGNIY